MIVDEGAVECMFVDEGKALRSDFSKILGTIDCVMLDVTEGLTLGGFDDVKLKVGIKLDTSDGLNDKANDGVTVDGVDDDIILDDATDEATDGSILDLMDGVMLGFKVGASVGSKLEVILGINDGITLGVTDGFKDVTSNGF